MSGKAIGIAGLVMAVPGTLLALNELGVMQAWDPIFSGSPCGVLAPAEVTLSDSTAPRGASVTVFGSCFDDGERVAIRVHVTEVGSAIADSEGSFTQTITVPASAPPPGFPTNIAATGRSSIKTATAPFTTG